MEKTSLKVSIAVPVYGVEKYIERCARSLFEQTYADIEYLFVDDYSPDHSIEVLKRVIREYPNREKNVRIIKHEVNRGLAAARNTAVDNCRTEFLFHIDSDDFLELDAIEKMVKEQKKDDYDIVTGNIRIIYPNKEVVLRNNEPTDKQELILDYIKPQFSHVLCGRLIRKSLYTDNNIFAAEGYNIGEDHQVTPRLFYYANSFSSIDDCIYNYDRSNENSYIGQSAGARGYSKKVLNDLKAFDILYNFFKSKPETVYVKCTSKEMALYIVNNAVILARLRQKGAFYAVWHYYNTIEKSSIGELPQYNIIYNMLIRNYYMCMVFYKFRIDMFYKRLYGMVQRLK